MRKRVTALFYIMTMCFGMIGCGFAGNVESQELIRGDAPEQNDELIHVGIIQTGKESDWRDANTDDYIDTFTVEKVYNIEEGVYTYKNAAEFIDERKY